MALTRTEINDIVAANEPLVWFIIRNYYPAFIDDEDIYQTGLIALWQAVEKYDSRRGAQLGTFASVCIRSKIADELKRRKTHEPIIPNVSLDDPSLVCKKEDGLDDTGEPYTLLSIIGIADEDYDMAEYDWNINREGISDRDWDMLTKNARGWTMAEIGRQYGMTRANISLIINKARRRLAQNLGIEYVPSCSCRAPVGA